MKKTAKVLKAMRVDGAKKIRLSAFSTDATEGVRNREDARERLTELTAALDDWQYKLYAESKTALLVVFQAMDTAGKDGVIRSVFGPINPQGVRVTSFKRPTASELAHDYLWRIHLHTPPKGMIGVFNRSHYEDVLVHRVHGLEPLPVIKQRYEQINAFEKHLRQNRTVIVKFFLHISKDEQKKRLQARLDTAKKRWKFEMGDLEERKFWEAYQDAYQIVLNTCSKPQAPWYVIPADHKWYRDWAVCSILVETLRSIDPHYPKPEKGLDGVTVT